MVAIGNTLTVVGDIENQAPYLRMILDTNVLLLFTESRTEENLANGEALSLKHSMDSSRRFRFFLECEIDKRISPVEKKISRFLTQ
jgi:hypothetical protein